VAVAWIEADDWACSAVAEQATATAVMKLRRMDIVMAPYRPV
jgi:hypothetical protein